ncbi:MAG: zf-TFIIB domain-containing protein [Polyangiaceae bacterium]|nr:zf-TFIIB domain-containing protein [Polyangiaceae bacterium]
MGSTETSGPYRRSPTPHIERPDLVHEQHPAGIEVDRCPICGGVWLDRGELEAIEVHARGLKRPDGYQSDIERMKRAYKLAHRPETRAPEEEPPPLACPKCGEAMFPREWSIGTLVMVNVCIDCRGVWIEAEELSALEQLFAGI